MRRRKEACVLGVKKGLEREEAQRSLSLSTLC